MFDVCESFHPSKVPKSFGFFEGFAPNALRKAGGKGRPGNDLKTTQPPPDTWKAFSTERKEIWIHFVLCCHTSSLSLSLRSTNCKGNQEEPKVENVSNCQIGGLWMDRPGRSPSQSSNQSKFVSFEFQHLPGNYGGGDSQGIYNVIHSVLILSHAEMQHLIQLVANVSVLIGAQVNLVTAALAHCPPSTCIKQIETLDFWNLCKAPLGKFRQHGF